jgi:hypothetical protein
MRATERLSLVDGDDENANSDDNADCKIGSNNESPTPPANKKKERKKERKEFAQTPSLVMYLLYASEICSKKARRSCVFIYNIYKNLCIICF